MLDFKELDAKMQVFETAHDVCVLPGIFIVARLDGRSFTYLTQEQHRFDAPYDPRFRDFMLTTSEHLMGCGPRCVYAYTQSDDISLLFHRNEVAFGRKERKLNSILAGEASAKFSLLLGAVASFDCRIIQLPEAELVREYFLWRYQCAELAALDEHTYWALRNEGRGHVEAGNTVKNASTQEKLDMLLGYGLRFGDLPNWQRRGMALFWEVSDKPAAVPGVTVTSTQSIRKRRIKRVMELPEADEYLKFVAEQVAKAAQ